MLALLFTISVILNLVLLIGLMFSQSSNAELETRVISVETENENLKGFLQDEINKSSKLKCDLNEAYAALDMSKKRIKENSKKSAKIEVLSSNE